MNERDALRHMNFCPEVVLGHADTGEPIVSVYVSDAIPEEATSKFDAEAKKRAADRDSWAEDSNFLHGRYVSLPYDMEADECMYMHRALLSVERHLIDSPVESISRFGAPPDGDLKIGGTHFLLAATFGMASHIGGSSPTMSFALEVARKEKGYGWSERLRRTSSGHVVSYSMAATMALAASHVMFAAEHELHRVLFFLRRIRDEFGGNSSLPEVIEEKGHGIVGIRDDSDAPPRLIAASILRRSDAAPTGADGRASNDGYSRARVRHDRAIKAAAMLLYMYWHDHLSWHYLTNWDDQCDRESLLGVLNDIVQSNFEHIDEKIRREAARGITTGAVFVD